MKIFKNERGIGLPIIIIGAVIVLVGVGFVAYRTYTVQKDNSKSDTIVKESKKKSEQQPSQSTQSSNANILTPDQIFTEVSSQFNLDRAQLVYFRIFGQDKVQYNAGPGANFVYKQSGKWHIAQANAQSLANCNDLNNVPEQFRPPCYDSVTQQEKYLNSNRESTNYPISQAIKYLPENF